MSIFKYLDKNEAYVFMKPTKKGISALLISLSLMWALSLDPLTDYRAFKTYDSTAFQEKIKNTLLSRDWLMCLKSWWKCYNLNSQYRAWACGQTNIHMVLDAMWVGTDKYEIAQLAWYPNLWGWTTPWSLVSASNETQNNIKFDWKILMSLTWLRDMIQISENSIVFWKSKRGGFHYFTVVECDDRGIQLIDTNYQTQDWKVALPIYFTREEFRNIYLGLGIFGEKKH